MKPWLPIIFLCLALVSPAADWQKDLTPLKPGTFPPYRPFHAQYTFGWSAFTAAQASFDLAQTNSGLLRLSVSTRSMGMVRTMWSMDAEHTSYVQPATFLPVRLTQSETYSDEARRTRLSFTPEGVTRMRETTPTGGTLVKTTKEFKFPNLLDLHGALHFVRSQKLQPGDSYKFVVYPSATPYLAKLQVLKREKLNVAGRKYNALKLDLKLWRVDDDDLKLKAYSKFKQANVWLSDDADRLLLRIEAEIFVGSVWAELEQIDFKPQPTKGTSP